MPSTTFQSKKPWNKGKLMGQKAPLRLRDIWEIRVRLDMAGNTRDEALFDLVFVRAILTFRCHPIPLASLPTPPTNLHRC